MCVFFACFSQAEQVAKSYIIGTEDIEYFPHYGKYSVGSSNFSGYARDIFDLFKVHSNENIIYKPLPIKRLYHSFINQGSVDFKYPDNPNWQVALKPDQQKIYYSAPISHFIDGTFVHIDNVSPNKQDILTLGIIRGFTPEAYLTMIKSGKVKVYEFSRTNKLINALTAKRVDAIYINVDVANYQKQANSQIVFNKTLPYKKGTYHLSTINHPQFIEDINQFLSENQPLIIELSDKYNLVAVNDFD